MASRKQEGTWVLLKNVAAGYELDIITSMLAELQIPIQKKSRGSGGYTSIYMGMSLTGYDIYVPADRLTEAKEVLEDAKPLEQMEEVLTNAPDDLNNEQPGGYILTYRSFFKKLLLIFFVIPSLLGLVYFVYQTISEALR